MRTNMSANTTTLTTEQREAIYEAWIAALWSGQYKQGRKHLELDSKFCPLGVLCHVLHQRPELGIEMDRFVTPDGTALYSTPTSPKCRSNAPDSIVSELGLSTKLPSAVHRAVEIVLMDLNDVIGASFAEIAQFIEGAVMPLLRTKGILPPAQQAGTSWNRGFQQGLETNRLLATQATDALKKEREAHAETNRAMTDALLMMEEREQSNKALLRQALEALKALKAEIEMLREALKDADNELDWLDEGVDPCDHSYWDMRRKVKAALAKENK